jgi:hypothetical protein
VGLVGSESLLLRLLCLGWRTSPVPVLITRSCSPNTPLSDFERPTSLQSVYKLFRCCTVKRQARMAQARSLFLSCPTNDTQKASTAAHVGTEIMARCATRRASVWRPWIQIADFSCLFDPAPGRHWQLHNTLLRTVDPRWPSKIKFASISSRPQACDNWRPRQIKKMPVSQETSSVCLLALFRSHP